MQETADYQTAEWLQNTEQSVIQVGRIVSELAPDIYSDGLEVQIDGPQGKQSVFVEAQELKGNLKICVTTSASYQSRKKHGAQILAQMASSNPDFARAFMDEILANSGADVSDEAMLRAKRMVPAYIKGEEPSPEDMQQLTQMQEAMSGMAQTIEQYEALISQLQAKVISDTQKAEMVLQGKIIDSQTSIVIEQMKQDGKLDEAQANMVSSVIQDIMKSSQKAVEASVGNTKGNVEVKYTSPMDQFTPLTSGPLVRGNA
jgi:hypothetical protein